MRILIGVASRHGSTFEIAETIGDELRTLGHTVDVRHAGDVREATRYDAAIVGSAIYMGNWLPEARDFVNRYGERLVNLPVWLFSSGPLGWVDPQPAGDPQCLQEIMQATHARGHQIFVGKLDKGLLGFGERMAVKMVRAPEGDFRDWEAIRAWARDIARSLAPATARVS